MSSEVLVFNRIDLNELAKQICLIDLELFSQIPTEEIDSFNWTSNVRKHQCPKLMKFTRQFNLMNMWAINEILKGKDHKDSKVLYKFIKLAKKLVEFRNYQSSYAIKSALSSAPIHRLEQSWNRLSRKHQSMWDSLEQLFSLDNNQSKLRAEMSPDKLPLVPYMGIYLADLTGLDCAHPKVKGVSPPARTESFQKIYNIIHYFQNSVYSFKCHPGLRDYVLSQEYIDELQNVIIDAYFYKSKELEPDVISHGNGNILNGCGSNINDNEDEPHCNSTTGGGGGDIDGKFSLNYQKNQAGTLKFIKVDKFNLSHRKCKSWDDDDEVGSYRQISEHERQHQTFSPQSPKSIAKNNGSPFTFTATPDKCKFPKTDISKNINLLDDSEVFGIQSSMSTPMTSTSGSSYGKSLSGGSQYGSSNSSYIKHQWQAADPNQSPLLSNNNTSPVSIITIDPDKTLGLSLLTNNVPPVIQGYLQCHRKYKKSLTLNTKLVQKYLVKLFITQLDCYLTFHLSKISKPRQSSDFKPECHYQVSLLMVDMKHDPLKTSPKIVLSTTHEKWSLKNVSSTTLSSPLNNHWPTIHQWWSKIQESVEIVRKSKADATVQVADSKYNNNINFGSNGCGVGGAGGGGRRINNQINSNTNDLINLEVEFTRL